ncbi:MAG TPA: MFS transporter, partial [Geminicoccaceae bacterium]|nr:MFS transporter [Geminicoccaceae bacterium]
SLLADPAFLRVWLTGGLAGVLRWLELLAISIYVLEATGSPFLVALMTFLRMAPMFLFGIPAGALADRYDRKQLLMIGVLVLAGASGVLALLAIRGQIALWHIGVGTFLNGMFWASEFPVRRIMLGEIAGVERLSRAMALESATSNATRMIGPALGGVLIQMIGLYGVFVLGALIYLACAVLVWPVAYRAAGAGGGGASLLTMLREGWRFARADRLIVGALAVTVIVNLWGFAYITMVPVIGEVALGLSPALIGVLMSTEGLGAVLGALLVARYDRPRQYTRIYTGSSAAFLLGVLAFALSTSFPLSLALILFCGIGIAGFAVMQSTILFLAAPAAVRSRIMGLVTVAIGAGPIGMLYVGVLADWLGASLAVALLALQGLVALGLAAWYWPDMRRPVDLYAAARQLSAGATSSRTAMPSSSGDGAG